MTNKDKNAFARSDLACERKTSASDKSTYLIRSEEKLGFTVRETVIHGDDYPAGRYVTVSIGNIRMEDDSRITDCITLLAEELSSFIDEYAPQNETTKRSIMVAGLGNRFITADSLGPLTVDKLTVTGHMMGRGGYFDKSKIAHLYAVQPGVLGQTGIEAAELISGAVRAVKPQVVIAIDALAARSTERLATTVQISDAGICPGSGIGNKRVAINEETVGCPVIAIGIPTVVDSATLVWDALETAGIEDASPSLHKVLENGRSFFVSPKDSDVIAEELSSILARTMDTLAGF